MKFSLKKVSRLSGVEASVYAVFIAGEIDSVFDQFLAEHKLAYLTEVRDIVSRLAVIGHKTGAREHFFKFNEGKYGDLVCALYDNPDKKLRLYCLRFGGDCIILGGGGPKYVRAWQDDFVLKQHAEQMIEVAKKIHARFETGDMSWFSNFKDIRGDLNFVEEDNE